MHSPDSENELETSEIESEDQPSIELEDGIGSIELDLDDQTEVPVAGSAGLQGSSASDQIPNGIVNIVDDEELNQIQEALDSESIDEEALLVEDLIANMNVEMKDSAYTELPPNTPVDVGNYLLSLPATSQDVERLVEKYELDFSEQGIEDVKKAPQHIRRLHSAIHQTAAVYQAKHYRNIFKRQGGDWKQGLRVSDDALLRQSMVSAKDNATNPVASIVTDLGLGTVIQIPLWHSGIWVAIRTAKDVDLINLEAEIAFEKATLGRGSNGAIFSNNEVYAKKAIVDFALRHVVKATTESIEPTYLSEVILETDWPMLAWGLLLASYPKGYRHLQPCVASPDDCDHVIDVMLNISRIAFVDNSRFTPSQIAHMKNRKNPNSLEKIRAYQEEHRLKADPTIKINQILELSLRTPTIGESIARGIEWVDAITADARKVFTSNMSEQAREEHKYRQATMASIRQYVQWFGSFRRVDRDKEYNSAEMVEEILSAINAKADFSKIVHNRIREFIDESTIATVALPKWRCPKCQKEPSAEYLRHPELIPIDVIDVFFTLLGQKIQRRLVEESTNDM